MTSIDGKLTAVIGETLDNAATILSAFQHVGESPHVGFTLATCCAVVEDESGGRMVWGHDPWNEREWPLGPALPAELEGMVVTEVDYHRYRFKRNRGYQPQGCGITQLTSPGLQKEAEKEGGCSVPFYNCLVGFREIKSLCLSNPNLVDALAEYNGSGPAAEAYGQRVAASAAGYQARFNAALD